jgi:tryptophan 2,3-dioxygenase
MNPEEGIHTDFLGKESTHILKIYENDPEKLNQAYESRSIYDVPIEALHRAGFSIDENVLHRDVRKPYQYEESVEQAWFQVYQNVEKYRVLYEMAEKLVIWKLVLKVAVPAHENRGADHRYKKGTGGLSGSDFFFLRV